MKHVIINIGISLLIILWIYAAGSKLTEFYSFKYQLSLQHFPWHIENLLVFALPISEVLTAYLIANKTTRKIGLWLSTTLLFVFSLYICLILLGAFDKAPCSCGGVLGILSWKTHLIFNLVFLSINCWTLYEINQQRKEVLKNYL